jgi:catechol 2,3-dioxygenase
MPDIESVMRGSGRVIDAGYPIAWGVGRHGPGNNVFAYFIGPFGFIIEYTAEILQVDDSYVARGPEDWSWPPGRADQWGIATLPSKSLKEAQRAIFFAEGD